MVEIRQGDNEERPCYIEFELSAEEDRDASIAQGMPVYKDVEMAYLTPTGCQGTSRVPKFITAKLLDDWRFGDKRRQGPVPYYIQAYDAWKAGLEIPANGLDIKNWPGVTPAQLMTCHEAGARTVEDLSEANADMIRKLGMGGLALIQKAKSYLENAETNKAAEEISALRIQMADMKVLIDTQNGRIAELQDTPQVKRGRPRKDAA